ncbi:MAG: hypothetical protein R2864_13020 [Syntrophotaleaceae bacterium]
MTAMTDTAESSARSASLTLLGTMVAGDRSLALLALEQETVLLQVDEELPGSGRIKQIERQRVVISWPDGTEQELLASEEPSSVATESASAESQGIRTVGENRWLISQNEIEKARANLNQLLKSARLEPKIVGGVTQGFLVRMVRSDSLVAKLGIKRGDLIQEVNGVRWTARKRPCRFFSSCGKRKKFPSICCAEDSPLPTTMKSIRRKNPASTDTGYKPHEIQSPQWEGAR